MGQAKAMVVTKDIECAIRYYWALNEIKEEKHLPYGILIAFSGSKTVDGVEFTEGGINDFPESKTPKEFNKDENRILVVANKYLTGFDQPKLAAMYIDKPLAGVLAVQALSRLNRAKPSLGKRSEDLFILDFFNKLEAAFDPYYTATALSEPTNVNILHDLRETLLYMGVFDQEEINEFAELYFHGATPDKWAHCIDVAANRFNNEIEWPEDGKADFKMKAKQFVKVYSKVAAIMTYEMKEWEKLFWYLRFLIPSLHVDVPGRDDLKDLLDNVDLNTYGLRRTALNQSVELDATETVVDPNKPVMAGAGGDEIEIDVLDEIVRAFNEMNFKGWEATPVDQRAKLINIVATIAQEHDYTDLVVGNPDPEASETALNNIIDRVIRQKRTADMSLYKQYQQNEEFKSQMRSTLGRLLNAYCSAPEQTMLKGVGFTQGGQQSIITSAIAARTQGVSAGMAGVRKVSKNPAWKNVALSVKQPWATLICSGIKDIENRSWQTDYRGRLYIVASSTNVTSDFENGYVPQEWQNIITEQQLKGNLPDLHAFPQSAVIGYVDLVDCTGEAVDSVWSVGSIADGNVNWVLKNAHIFNHALFPGFKAKLNLFEIPELDEDNLPPSKIIEL